MSTPRAESVSRDHGQEWRAVGRYPDGQKAARSAWYETREEAEAIAAQLKSCGANEVRIEPRFARLGTP